MADEDKLLCGGCSCDWEVVGCLSTRGDCAAPGLLLICGLCEEPGFLLTCGICTGLGVHTGESGCPDPAVGCEVSRSPKFAMACAS